MEDDQSARPSGTVTFLFTDIEGSTRLWESNRDEMSKAVALHDRMLKDIINRHHGYVFKTVGDAFCAAFRGAAPALEAALAIGNSLAKIDWRSCPVRVRMGLHAGLAEERDNDYFGQALNRTARLMAAGSGSQILVSAAVKELLADSLMKGVSLRDLGLRRLKDLSSPEHIWQVDQEGKAVDFPPLRTLDLRPNNLPIQTTEFIGRERERKEITGILSSARLVTLFGPGGTGKTRLCLECAADLLDAYHDGVWFIDLAPVGSGELVATAIGHFASKKRFLSWTIVNMSSIHVLDWQRRSLALVPESEFLPRAERVC
jgi:class 3 adenylate cyclase